MLPSDLLEHLEHVSQLLSEPRVGLAVDFDGTVAELVVSNDTALVDEGCARSLATLSGRLALVAVVSGREVCELQKRVGLPQLVYVGNHGVEVAVGGRVEASKDACLHRGTLDAVVRLLKMAVAIPGLVWEHKGVGVAVHYRGAPDADVARSALERALATSREASGLDVIWGNRVLDLRPRIGVDKGTALERLARGYDLGAVMFIGDDTTDIDAVTAVSRLRSQGGVKGLAVAVRHPESPQALLDAADYHLEGVPAVRRFLGWMVDQVPP